MAQRMLIVDDEKSIRELLGAFFEEFGYEVYVAGDGEEALGILEGRAIPVILLDLNLPGMSGLDVCLRIREKNPDACIFAVTGYHAVYSLEECRANGFDDFFTKPVNLNILHNAVIRGFEKTGASPG